MEASGDSTFVFTERIVARSMTGFLENILSDSFGVIGAKDDDVKKIIDEEDRKTKSAIFDEDLNNHIFACLNLLRNTSKESKEIVLQHLVRLHDYFGDNTIITSLLSDPTSIQYKCVDHLLTLFHEPKFFRE